MPVILDPGEYDAWLDPDNVTGQGLQSMLDAAPVKLLTFYPISTRVNSPRNDDPSIIEPLAQTGELFN